MRYKEPWRWAHGYVWLRALRGRGSESLLLAPVPDSGLCE
jgi:hypothetical protein